MRPCVSVSGTRCTRCTPDSNFSLANAPRPCTSAMISLKPPMVPSLAEITSTFQPCRRGEPLIHPEQVAGEQRGLVAAGAGADFQHHVAVVHGVLGQQRDANLLRQFGAPAPAASRARLPPCRAFPDRWRDPPSAARRRQSRPRRAIGLHGVDQRIELGELARDLDIFLGIHLAKQLGLERGVVGEQDIEFGFG